MSNALDIKNARSKVIGEPSRLIQMFSIANVEISFEYAKEKLKLLFIKKYFAQNLV